MSLLPTESTSGDIESMALLAGQSAGQVYDLPPAAAIIAECIDGARRLIIALAATAMKDERSCGSEAPG